MYCGIDPGNSGALAFFNEQMELLAVVDMPIVKEKKKTLVDGVSLASLLKEYSIKHCAIEAVYARPGQGVVSMFSFGQGLGTALGVLQALNIEITKVSPQVWQKRYINGDKSDKKRLSRACLSHYPATQIYGPKGGLKDGRSDAILIADYVFKHSKDNLDTAA